MWDSSDLAEACRGRPRTLQACLGRCKACRDQPRILPSMPRSCIACLHILGTYNTAYKTASGGGVSLRCGTSKTLQKHAKVGQGCKACLGRCKACQGRSRTLSSMHRSCITCLHILGTHILVFFYILF